MIVAGVLKESKNPSPLSCSFFFSFFFYLSSFLSRPLLFIGLNLKRNFILIFLGWWSCMKIITVLNLLCVWWDENTNSPAIIGLLVMGFLNAKGASWGKGSWTNCEICGWQSGLWFGLVLVRLVRGLDMADTVLANFSRRFSSTLVEGENEQLIWTASFFRPKWSSSISPLKFWCLAIKPFSLKISFFFNFAPRSMQLDPWIFKKFN